MKNASYIFFVFLFLLSCHSRDKKETAEYIPVKELTKLEHILLQPCDSVMNECDLSNDSIVAFPDLSAYTIRSLNLSGNLLDTIIPQFLPKKLEKLNLSHNRFSGKLHLEDGTMCTLKELNLSYNELIRIYVGDPLYRIIVSHNDLLVVDINHRNIQYLDVSYNSRMSQRVAFDPERIDTIIREGVANGEHLTNPHSFPMCIE